MTHNVVDRSSHNDGPMTRPSWIALAAVCALACVLGYLQIFSPDVGNHLASGRWIVAHGWPDHDPLTWTRTEAPYVDLLWGWHVLLWLLYRGGGTLLLVLTGILLTLATYGLCVHRVRRQDPALLPLCAPALLLFGLANLWELRPHLASWVLLSLLLLALERGTYWALPLVMLVWVNTHSLFILGPVAIGAYVAAELLRGREADRRLLLWAGAAVAACLLNPWGVHGFLFPLEQLAELQGSSPFKAAVTGIAEFRSPYRWSSFLPEGNLVLLQPLLFMHVYSVLALAGVAAAAWRRRLRLSEGLLFALFFYVWTSGQKNFGYLAVASFPVVLRGWGLLLPGTRPVRWAWSTVAASALVLCLFVNGFIFAHERVPHRFGHAFNAQMLPVRACAFLKDKVPQGRLLNTLGDGGYVEFATGWPVFIDGRNEVIGPAFFARYQQMQGLEGFPAALARWQPQVVLVRISEVPAWFVTLDQDKAAWRCAYLDEQSAVFLRNDFATEVPAAVPLIYPSFTEGETDAILAEARSGGFRPWRILTGPHDYPLDAMQWTTLALLRGNDAAALGYGLSGVRRATVPVPDLWHNLALAFAHLQDARRARACLEQVPPERRDPRLEEALGQKASTRKTGTTSLAPSQ